MQPMLLVDADTGCSPLEAPQQSQSLRMRASKDSQVLAKGPTVSTCPYVQYHPKRSNNVRKADKLYVGLLLEMPPSVDVQIKWDTEVRTNLENDLCQVTRQLPQYMTDREVMIELILCMAGTKCSKSDSSLPVEAECMKSPLRMIPTVWIYCGSRKCKKKVSRSCNSRLLDLLTTYTHCLWNVTSSGLIHGLWDRAKRSGADAKNLSTSSDQSLG
jgi:hypothetical protein